MLPELGDWDMHVTTRLGMMIGLAAVLAFGCERQEAEDPSGYGQQQPGYGQQQPQPQGAQPSPLALPCQSDVTCGTHRCNLQTGRCAFPCGAPADCAAGMGCMSGLCVPGAPVSPTQ